MLSSIMRPAGVVVLALCLAAPVSRAAAQQQQPQSSNARAVASTVDPERLTLARELLGLMNTGPSMLKGLELGLQAQKMTATQLPDTFWVEFAARARREMPKFIESVVPVYASRFTGPELRQLIAFYRTPVGHRLAEQAPELSADMMRAGQLWGVQLGADTAKDLAAAGVMFHE